LLCLDCGFFGGGCLVGFGGTGQGLLFFHLIICLPHYRLWSREGLGPVLGCPEPVAYLSGTDILHVFGVSVLPGFPSRLFCSYLWVTICLPAPSPPRGSTSVVMGSTDGLSLC
jgi:hypothetical protein